MPERSVELHNMHGATPLSAEALTGAPDKRSPVRPLRLTPAHLAYSMGPAALVAILVLVHFAVVARESAWLWVAVFFAIPVASLVGDHVYRCNPSRQHLHLRIAIQAGAATIVIYLTGWGPVLTGAYAFMALENIAHAGSKVWRVTAFWTLLGIGLGQVAVSQHWVPSRLSLPEANALALMGAFVLFFTIRMAGATAERQENAESEVRLSEDRFRSLIHNSSDTTMLIDAAGYCTYVSPAVAELLDIEPIGIVGRMGSDFIHPDDRDRARQRFGATAGSEMAALQLRMIRSDGSFREVEAVVTNLVNRPSVAGYVVNIRDITERKEFEALLAHRAQHDPLTGLVNRQFILDRAEQMLARRRRANIPIAVYFIDLDDFKTVNDSFGHGTGDRLLQEVAGRFVAALRESDTVGRLGGDEFIILAEGHSLLNGPEAVAERVRGALAEPFHLSGVSRSVVITASIGIATGDRDTAQGLLHDADVALYRAKAAGKNQTASYAARMPIAEME
jgi:diguanylate cyclase (GGDEF)-like protein/PAS domain S-box-containing protein